MLPLSQTKPRGRRVARSVAIAVGAGAVFACAETPTGARISPDVTPLLNLTDGDGAPQLFSNAVKYRDVGAKPATGRSGSASLTARALLGRDHETHLEITTGTLDDGSTPPGNLDKIQIKVLDPAGNAMSTTNYNKLRNGGYASYGFANLVRGSGLQVQANVGGIDPNRTDVVTVTETVKLRPDLVAAHLNAPERALVNAPVEIAAVVREANGDVGARASCVLSVDGEPVATGVGIWVDAGDDVSCAFTIRFPTTGTKQISVAVTDVVPGDFDPGNNSRMRTIVIDGDGFRFGASAYDMTLSYSYRSQWSSTYTDAEGTQTTSGSDVIAKTYESAHQYGGISGTLDRELPFPLDKVTFSHATNGATITSGGYAALAAEYTYDDWYARQRCAWRWTYVDNSIGSVSFSICSGAYKSSGQEVPFTSFSHYRSVGQATYFVATRHDSYRVKYQDGTEWENKWTYNYDERYPRVLPKTGADYTISLTLTAGGAEYGHEAVIPLKPFTFTEPAYPWTCHDWTDGPWSYKSCSETGKRDYKGIEGFVSGVGTVKAVMTP